MLNLLYSTAVLAAEDTIQLAPTDGLASELTGITVGDIVSGFIKLIIILAAVIFFFILVIGGIRWIVSGGDKTQTETARGQITSALVGLVIVFAAWAILQLIETFFGVQILTGLDIPKIQ